MATLEQIIEEARRLPVEEQRRLRAALESLDSNGEGQPASQEMSPQQPQSQRVNNGDDEIRQLRRRANLLRRAEAQGVKPFASLEDFAGDPDLTADFDVDAFLRQVREDRDRASGRGID